jgi:ubiquinone/menaquinone biosynthesis C-methylase UbiE
MDPTKKAINLKESYDRVAQHYAQEYYEELKRKPFDREILDDFAESVKGRGAVCEIGCGPGQIARYLKDKGTDVHGLDLSPEMVNCAHELNGDINFNQGDMLSLGAKDKSLAGIVSFYAIIHLKRDEVTKALKEMQRVLEPGGRLLVSFHGGEGQLHRDEWYGEPVAIDVTLFTSDEMKGYLELAGFEVERIAERDPYEFEYPTQRMYAFATKPI